MMKLAFRHIEINGNLYFTKNWDSEISQKFTHRFNCSKAIFQIKKLNESNFYNLDINPIQSVYLFSLKIYMVY